MKMSDLIFDKRATPERSETQKYSSAPPFCENVQLKTLLN